VAYREGESEPVHSAEFTVSFVILGVELLLGRDFRIHAANSCAESGDADGEDGFGFYFVESLGGAQKGEHLFAPNISTIDTQDLL
jgi:hypothetical protein